MRTTGPAGTAALGVGAHAFAWTLRTGLLVGSTVAAEVAGTEADGSLMFEGWGCELCGAVGFVASVLHERSDCCCYSKGPHESVKP